MGLSYLHIMAKILVIDDDVAICTTLERIFREQGHEVACVHTLDEGLEKAIKMGPDAVFLDVCFSPGNGLEYLPLLRTVPSRPEVIVITGYANPDSAERAIKADAWDYIQKPASMDSLVLALENAIQYRRQKLLSDPVDKLNRRGIVGRSPALNNCLSLAARCAKNDSHVLIYGETGTGKEMFARLIHENSPRADRNFVVVDCGSLPKTLAESLLFGHAKGAYTGAHKAETGLVRHAHQGTLFLDEVGELPLTLQKAFLRVLEERRFRPIGEVDEVESDFRLISATNKDLARMAAEGKFREDLLFRLQAVTIHLPALRDRVDDIKLLVEDFIEREAKRTGFPRKKLTPMFLKDLESYPWPGNVRELQHAMESVFAEAQDEPLFFARHLPASIRASLARSAFTKKESPATPAAPTMSESYAAEEEALTAREVALVAGEAPKGPEFMPIKWQDFRRTMVEDGERRYLVELLAMTEGEVKRAAALSGLSAPRLYELLRKHRITSRYSTE